MLILNYTHPLTPDQIEQITALLGTTPEIRTIPVQIDHSQPLDAQIAALIDAAGLTTEAWQTTPLIINPPGFAPAAAALCAELHGRSGHFPTLLRLRPIASSTPTRYEVAELLNLQAVRDQARERR